MIEIKYTKTTLQDPAQMLRLRQPMAIAKATANAIRDRIVHRGELATPAKPYATRPTAGPKRHKSYYVSPAYAALLGHANQTKFKSSADFHQMAGAKPGLANVSGRMWAGLTVRNSGNRAIIEFGGSSLGARSTRTALTRKVHGSYEVTLSENGKLRAKQKAELKRSEDGQVEYRRKPRLVRNQEKAGTVFKNSRVGLLQPTPAESRAQWSAFRDYSARLTSLCFGGAAPTAQPQGDSALYSAILKEFK